MCYGENGVANFISFLYTLEMKICITYYKRIFSYFIMSLLNNLIIH